MVRPFRGGDQRRSGQRRGAGREGNASGRGDACDRRFACLIHLRSASCSRRQPVHGGRVRVPVRRCFAEGGGRRAKAKVCYRTWLSRSGATSRSSLDVFPRSAYFWHVKGQRGRQDRWVADAMTAHGARGYEPASRSRRRAVVKERQRGGEKVSWSGSMLCCTMAQRTI